MALFMSEAERRREKRRMRRRAVREVENAVDAARAKYEGAKKKRDAQWAAASKALKGGDEASARRILESVAADDAMLARLSARLAQFEEVERRMGLAEAGESFEETAAAFARFAKTPLAEPEAPQADAATADALFEKLAEEARAEAETSGAGRPGRAPSAPALKVEQEADEASRKWTATKPDAVSLDDVIGLDDAKATIVDALVNPVKHPEVYSTLRLAPGTGLLLYGPPGTGKTLFAKAVANALDMPFMEVRCDRLKSKYVGETEKNVAEMFRAARAMGRCVLFLDECNAILSRRGDQKVCMVEQFLVELDGFAASDAQIFVLMATNLPWTLDSAITRSGRLSEAVYVGLPDEAARRKLLDLALRGVPLAPDVDLGRLAADTEGFSGADIAAKGGLCHKAKTLAARRWVARIEGAGGAEGDGAEGTPRPTIADCAGGGGQGTARPTIADCGGGDGGEPVTMADFEAAFAGTTPVAKSAADVVRRNLEFSMDKGGAA